MNYHSYFESTIGRLLLMSDGTALTGLYLEEPKYGPALDGGSRFDDEAAPFPETKRQLAEYFNGTRATFDLPLAMHGTEFQKQVWKALLDIPFGVTMSYGELARKIGNPNASRAVGLANGRNPISIIVPCHRVIGSNGSLTGYGGGLPRKEALLSLERSVTRPSLF